MDDSSPIPTPPEKAPEVVNVKYLDKRLRELTLTVSRLGDIVASLIQKAEKPAETTPTPPLNIVRSDYRPKGYVPAKYRQICDEVLSPEFGMDCAERSDSMDFEVQIIIPHAYSSLTDQEKAAGMQDIRTRVISRALGEQGVRDCVQR